MLIRFIFALGVINLALTVVNLFISSYIVAVFHLLISAWMFYGGVTNLPNKE